MPKLAVQCLVEVKTYYSVVFFFTPKCISREKYVVSVKQLTI